MSQKPYIVQEGSPNLVIVPTDTLYVPSPKVKESEALLKPTPSSSYSSVFARKTSALNYSCVNNDVLIDVRKVQRSPKSWATNFLQSIGGPSTKFDRIYALAPKPTCHLKNSTIQPENYKEDTLTDTINQQHIINIKSTPQTMEKKTSQPKININLIKPKPKPQPTLAKEDSNPNCNTDNNTPCKPTYARKEPSLPKNYKIPMQSKCNKPAISLTDNETSKSNSSNSIYLQNSITSKNQTTMSSHRSNEDMVGPNYNKIAIPNITTNKDMADLNKNKKPNQPKHDLNNSQHGKHADKTHIKVIKNTEHTKHGNEPKQIKTNKVLAHHISHKHEQTAQSMNNKENNQPKHNKESIQRKAVKESDLLRNHKDHCPQRNTSLKTNEDIIAHIKTIKEMYKLKRKKELSYSTKLKTKKEHISVASSMVSKIAKHIKSKDNQNKDTLSKKHKIKSVTDSETHLTPSILTKKDIISKLKKKRALENKSSQSECSSSKTKKIRLASPDTNAVKNKISKTVNKERLSKSNSPIKSVVSRIKTDQPFNNSETLNRKKSDCYHSHYDKTSTYHCQNSDKYFQRSSNVDLRTKLKRKNSKSDYRKEGHQLSYAKKDKFAIVPNVDRFVPEENLIISFNPENDSEDTLKMKKSPAKKLARKQSSPKDKKCKKIKLEINIVFGQGDTTDEESTKSEAETNEEMVENMDLSFLDDFNVDEIAESLNECKDCIRKNNEKEVTEVDINVQDSISGDNNKKEITVNKKCMSSNTNGSMCKDIGFAENKSEDYLKTSVHPTVTKLRPCHEETQNINSIIGTGVDNKGENQGIDKEIKSELSQKNNVTCDTTQECAMTDNKYYITQNKSNCEENERTHDNTLQLVTKMERTEIIMDTANEKQHLTSKTPMGISRSESNIYSDHNDIIDALQDTSNLEMNAIKSYIASLNNNTNNQTRFDQKHATYTRNKTTTLTCIKEDPDVILIDDSDTENETEIKNNQLVKDNNAANVKFGKESLPYKSGEVSIVEPAGENSESILILDANAETSQAIKESMLNTSDEVTIIEHAGENTEPILILDTNAETSQPVKKSQFDRSGDVTIIESASEDSNSTLILDVSAEDLQLVKKSQLDKAIVFEPTGVNSETVLLFHTDNNIEESNSTPPLNESDQKEADSKNIITAEQSKKNKTTPEDALIKMITSKSADIDSENQITKEIGPDIAKTEIHQNKDNLPNTTKVASKTDQKTSGESQSKTTVKEGIPVKSPPKIVAVKTKTQTVNTKRDTKAHSKVNSETHKEDKEKVTKNSDDKGAERNFSLANSKFVQIMEAKLAPFMGQKCTVTAVINDGRFSKIYRCKDADNQDYAIKTLKKQFDGYNVGLLKQNMMLELQNGVPEDNLNCVRYIQGFVVSGLWCFLMEYFPMNLQQALNENKRSFHIDDVQVLSRQLVSAVTILRNNNIIHSDIKPSHILINASQTRIKLCGFDQAAYFEDINLLPNTGTVNYRAPELILGYPAGYGVDVWSTALVMYEMATNRKLFHGFYNNNILHQQLCTLGAIPIEMLMESQFRNAHFRGTAFIKFYKKNEKRIIDEIEFNDRLNTTLFHTYTTDWGQKRQANKRSDKAKIRAFSELLHNMLATHPRYRIAIEFVFANPFIYESLDDC